MPRSRRARRALPRLLAAALAALLLTGLAATAALAVQGDDEGASDGPVVDILPVEGLLDPPVAGAITDLVEEADARGGGLVVVQVDGRGAVSADLERLLTTIRDATVPVVVYAGPGGAGAEAGGGVGLLLLAGHVSVIAPDATVGPLDPADLGNAAGDPGDPGVELAGRLVADLEDGSGAAARVLDGAVTAEDAEELGLVDVLAQGLEPLLTELDGRTVETAAGEVDLRLRRGEAQIRLHSLGLFRRMLHAATTPSFIYLLFAAGLTALLFELFQPGFGVAGIAGVITAAIGVFGLTVLPVAWWAVGLLVLGLGLFAVDAALAGFGAVTLAATASFGAGSWWLYDSPSIELSTWLIAGTTVAELVFFVVVLTVVLRAQAPPDEAAVEELVGRPGIVRSVLNPEGHVYVDDALWRARWIGESHRAKVGTPVTVTGVDGSVLLVEPFEAGSTADAGGR